MAPAGSALLRALSGMRRSPASATGGALGAPSAASPAQALPRPTTSDRSDAAARAARAVDSYSPMLSCFTPSVATEMLAVAMGGFAGRQVNLSCFPARLAPRRVCARPVAAGKCEVRERMAARSPDADRWVQCSCSVLDVCRATGSLPCMHHLPQTRCNNLHTTCTMCSHCHSFHATETSSTHKYRFLVAGLAAVQKNCLGSKLK